MTFSDPTIDAQMQRWSTYLRDNLKISPDASNHLATTIGQEVYVLPSHVKQQIVRASPVALQDRLTELDMFQVWMDLVHTTPKTPAVIRAQVIVQNYICFVYLGEACFKLLKQHAPAGSTTKKCCTFLLNNPVRAFRNALAHGNWQYNADYSGLEFWARKGSQPDESMVHWTVSQMELDFWQSLARCTAYAAFRNL